MGDRGNIALQYDGNPTKRVYLYTHWGGSEMDETIAAALARGKERWDDPPYLARVIFCELIHGDTQSVTSYGIDVEPGDNEHAIRVVDIKNKTVFQEADNRKGFDFCKIRCHNGAKPVPFAEFITKHAATTPA